MKIIFLLMFLVLIVYKYTKRYSSHYTCPYCKSKVANELEANNFSPFKIMHQLFQIKAYTCQSCLHHFYQSNNKQAPQLN